jgi:hypothetical protein
VKAADWAAITRDTRAAVETAARRR